MTRKGALELAFLRSVRVAKLQPVDEAAKATAQRLAQKLDGGDLRSVGAYLTALTALGMTPASRSKLTQAIPPQTSNGLDELRSRRENRA